MEYESLFRALWDKNIRSLVCGGLAVNIYGIPRMTADIDLLIDFEKDNLTAFKTVLDELSYHSSVPVPILELADKSRREQLIQDKNMIAFSFFNSRFDYMTVDVLLSVPLSFTELWERREVRGMREFSVNIVSIEDLVSLKTFANRKQDKDDVILLSKLINGKK